MYPRRYRSSVLCDYLSVMETSILNYRKYIDPLGIILPTTNMNGWQSRYREFPFYTDWAQYFLDYISKCFMHSYALVKNPDLKYPPPIKLHGNNFNTVSWFNINYSNEFNSLHTHPVHLPTEFELSGVFYVTDPGDMFYYVENEQQINITSKAGDLLLFPTNLEHGVLPHDTEETRISIAFNAFLEETPPDSDENVEVFG